MSTVGSAACTKEQRHVSTISKTSVVLKLVVDPSHRHRRGGPCRKRKWLGYRRGRDTWRCVAAHQRDKEPAGEHILNARYYNNAQRSTDSVVQKISDFFADIEIVYSSFLEAARPNSPAVKVLCRKTVLEPGTQAAHCAGTLFFQFAIFLLSVRVSKGGVGISDLSYDAMPILSHNRVSGPY